jgi:hypothetical protein
MILSQIISLLYIVERVQYGILLDEYITVKPILDKALAETNTCYIFCSRYESDSVVFNIVYLHNDLFISLHQFLDILINM